ncbi:ATP-grasp domain-containing protein [Alienimonas sp. DA493]|uniref:ATP-grasp domain-containing protein n=1 Tax=Alienimonas sp. DA493 TaxID=3373605 RepID=UPI003754E4AC
MTGGRRPPRWIVDPDVLPVGDPLPSAVRAAGGAVALCDSSDPEDLDRVAGCGSAVFRGSVEAAAAWTAAGAPIGVWANFPALRFEEYSGPLRPWLLNADPVRLTLAELADRRDAVLDRVGVDGRAFVRPDAASKPFAGTQLRAATWQADVERLAFYDVAPAEPVLACRPRRVECEWRAVIAAGAVVAGCLYRKAVGPRVEPGLPEPVRRLAEKAAASGYAPDSLWCLDLCESGGDLFVLEVGAFACASLYGCDRGAVVAAAHAALAAEPVPLSR